MTSQRNHIVVGTDGSASALHAVRWAAREAALRRRVLHVVTTYTVPVSGYPDGLNVAQEIREALTAQAADRLAQAQRCASEEADDLIVTTAAVEAGTQVTLRASSRDADLVVVGSRGRGGFTGLLLGSTAVDLAAHAACAVVVVRGDEDSDAGPVVVGVDGTALSEPAVGFAFEEAALRGAPVVAVHTWHDDAFEDALHTAVADEFRDIATRHAEERVQALLAGWREKHPDIEVSTDVSGGSAARALVRSSKGAQLVVVGSRGRGGFAGLALGSTSQAVIRHANAPVVVVRHAPDVAGVEGG